VANPFLKAQPIAARRRPAGIDAWFPRIMAL